jgi:hypothetical protein
MWITSTRENAYPTTCSLGHNRYRSNINIGLCGEEYIHTDLKRGENNVTTSQLKTKKMKKLSA